MYRDNGWSNKNPHADGTIGGTTMPMPPKKKQQKDIINLSLPGNAGFEYVVPDGHKFKLLGGFIWLDTNGTAANRSINIQIHNQYGDKIQGVYTANITANQIGLLQLLDFNVNTAHDSTPAMEFSEDVYQVAPVFKQIFEGMKIYIDIRNGVAGDVAMIKLYGLQAPLGVPFDC